MKRSRITEVQIIGVLRKAEAGAKTPDLQAAADGRDAGQCGSEGSAVKKW